MVVVCDGGGGVMVDPLLLENSRPLVQENQGQN